MYKNTIKKNQLNKHWQKTCKNILKRPMLNHAACFVAQSYPTECHPSKAPQPRNYDRRQGATVEGTKGGLKRQNAWGLGGMKGG